jgi:O-antigen ligase
VRRAVLTACRVAGLVAAGALFAAWQLTAVPLTLKLLPAAVLALTLVRPAAGLLAMAGLGPVVGGWAVVLASPFGATHAFEQLVLAVLIGAGVRGWRSSIPLRLAEPALLLSSVAVASAIAVQPALLMYQLPGLSAGDLVRMLLGGAYFDRGMLGEPLTFAVMTSEALALAVVAERLVREDRPLARQVLRMVVVGHAGLALIGIDRIAGAALRTADVLPSIVRLLRDVRVSTYADLNAAGSVLAMVLVAGTGLLGDSRWRWATAIALPIIALGLWITGSRTALLALAMIAVWLLLAEAVRRRGRTRWMAVGATAAVLTIGLWTAAAYPSARNVSASTAVGARTFLAQIAVEMWRSAPILGVGIGRFWHESASFGGPDRRFGIVNENAHNNFLQVLAEQGAVGLMALVGALGAVFAGSRRPAGTSEPFKRFLAMGLVVFVLTWLGGHPLLQAEASFAFWLLAGVFTGLSQPPSPGRWRTLLAVAAVALLVSAPIRADRAIRDAGFEYVGAGVTGWRPELDGVRYREAGSAFELYLPADGTAVTLPLRRAPGAPDPLVVTLRVGGRQLDQVSLRGDTWINLAVQLPNGNRRFALVEFSAAGSDSTPITGSPLVFVGKTDVRSR